MAANTIPLPPIDYPPPTHTHTLPRHATRPLKAERLLGHVASHPALP
jgi:hypothetical protein